MSSSAFDEVLWRSYTRNVTPLGQPRMTAATPRVRHVRRSTSTGHTLDLHGLTTAEAHARTMAFLAEARYSYRYVTVITGLSGAIRREFPHWLDRHSLRREELNGGGSFRLYFKR